MLKMCEIEYVYIIHVSAISDQSVILSSPIIGLSPPTGFKDWSYGMDFELAHFESSPSDMIL